MSGRETDTSVVGSRTHARATGGAEASRLGRVAGAAPEFNNVPSGVG